jgi:hypothetical protein
VRLLSERDDHPTPEQSQQWLSAELAREKVREDSQREIFAAATAAATRSGANPLDLLWTEYQIAPYDPEYRSQMIAHQTEFPPDKKLRLLDMAGGDASRRNSPSEKDTSADFLPLVRQYLRAPNYNIDALITLSYARPDEAHDIALADLNATEQHYFNQGLRGKLAANLLDNPHLAWTPEQKEALDKIRH